MWELCGEGKVSPLIRWVDDQHALFVCPDMSSGRVHDAWLWIGLHIPSFAMKCGLGVDWTAHPIICDEVWVGCGLDYKSHHLR